METGIQDTAAYRIIRQVTDHTWGPDSDLEDEDIVSICSTFRKLGGSWESLMAGDMRSVQFLERSIDALVGPRSMVSSVLR